jgi:hypothetical protein
LHGVDHHGLGGAAAQGLHQRGWQGRHEIGVDAQVGEQPAEAFDHKAQQPALRITLIATSMPTR